MIYVYNKLYGNYKIEKKIYSKLLFMCSIVKMINI